MEPITVWVRHGAEWALIHRCKRCRALRSNRVAGDDNALALLALAVRPLANPAFPLDRIEHAPGAWDRTSGEGRRGPVDPPKPKSSR